MATFRGTTGDDVYAGTAGYDDIHDGGGGDDTLSGAGGDDYIGISATGAAFRRVVDGGSGVDLLVVDWATIHTGFDIDLSRDGSFTDGADRTVEFRNFERYWILAGDGNDRLTGGAGADILDGGRGDNLLNGGGGDDYLVSEGLGDTLIGGTGQDDAQLIYDTRTEDITFVLGDPAAISSILVNGEARGSVTGVEAVYFYAGFGNDRITGGANDDYIHGGGGEDIVHGGDGDDFLSAGRGFFRDASESGVNRLEGGAGDDYLVASSRQDVVDGGSGTDTAYMGYLETTGAIVFTLGDPSAVSRLTVGGTAMGSVTGVEQISFVGGTGNDHLTGGGGEDYLEGGSGDNVLNGRDGDDYLYSTSFGDTVDGGAGQDYVSLSFDTRAGDVVFALGRPTVVSRIVVDGVSKGAIKGVEALSFFGGSGDDIVTGGDSQDFLTGGVGDDTLDGGAGDDFIYGGRYSVYETGTNSLRGGAGDDRLQVGSLRDVLEGGSGQDTAVIGLFDGSVQSPITFVLGAPSGVSRIRVDGVNQGSVTGVEILQFFGGAGDDQVTGGAGDDSMRGGRGDDVLDGAAGVDTITFEFETNLGATVDLAAETSERRFAGSNAVFDSDTVRDFENAFGSFYNDILRGDGGANRLSGSGGDDLLEGRGGNDTLDGGGDNDRMVGGTGDDTYYADSGDVIIEADGEGDDHVFVYGDFSLAGQFIERLTLLFTGTNGTGNGLANTITGNDLDNVLSGALGDDILMGGDGDDELIGGAGSDRMVGGEGDDAYRVNENGDRVIEASGEGDDHVLSAVDFSLAGQFIERLTLTGTARSATGNSLANTLTGNTTHNILDGGSGADVMIGGAGNDRFIVDHARDRAVEANREGDDRVVASVSYSLAGTFVERLDLTGSANLNGTGNSLDNILTGNAGINVLTGGAGDDTFYVQTQGDRVIELTGEGDDHVLSSVDFSLAGQYIERLTLTGTARSGTGNSLANTLVGNASNNILDGGSGVDLMTGGKGNDRYIVDNTKDRVVELNREGDDRVIASVSYDLGGTYVERLDLSGSAHIHATGNSLANILTGNSGNNRLEGGGGADTLIGGAGFDRYVYRSVTDSTLAASDRIAELAYGDRLDLSLIDADSQLLGNQAFALVDAFSGRRGQATLDFSASANTTTLLIDTDGDRDADMRILIGGDANEDRIVW